MGPKYLEDIDPVYWKGSNYSFGGVFLPGIIGGYDYPIYITALKVQ